MYIYPHEYIQTYRRYRCLFFLFSAFIRYSSVSASNMCFYVYNSQSKKLVVWFSVWYTNSKSFAIVDHFVHDFPSLVIKLEESNQQNHVI